MSEATEPAVDEENPPAEENDEEGENFNTIGKWDRFQVWFSAQWEKFSQFAYNIRRWCQNHIHVFSALFILSGFICGCIYPFVPSESPFANLLLAAVTVLGFGTLITLFKKRKKPEGTDYEADEPDEEDGL